MPNTNPAFLEQLGLVLGILGFRDPIAPAEIALLRRQRYRPAPRLRGTAAHRRPGSRCCRHRRLTRRGRTTLRQGRRTVALSAAGRCRRLLLPQPGSVLDKLEILVGVRLDAAP